MLRRACATQLRRGLSLVDALERQPARFPPLFVATVRAAETHRRRHARRCRATSSTARRSTRVRRKVVAASVYPAAAARRRRAGDRCSCWSTWCRSFSRIYEERRRRPAAA
ncbi:MAG: type II secretion system F family protein [Comamonadaceae bacterium]|nr:type II secretion system F family protein [Comamonadaceae bacterium]